jgi:hypothetical protein
MRKFLIAIFLIVIAEVFLLQPISKIGYLRRLNQVDSSLAITPQILILRRNFEEIIDRTGVSTMPLGSKANSNIVFCEEANGMIEYRSDRYGFRNPDVAWDRGVEIAMIGDSFAQGACVKDGDDIASHLRNAFGNVLNLGSSGNGPLANIAVASEYLQDQPPKRLLWFYVANDLGIDLPIEEQTPLIAAYRDPKFSQSLRYRQKDTDELISDFLNQEQASESDNSIWRSLLKLTNTQNALLRAVNRILRLDPWRQGMDMDYARADSIDYEGFAELVRSVRSRLPKAVVQLVIVPDAGMFSSRHQVAVNLHIQRIGAVMKDSQIELIDLRKTFDGVPDPLSFYALKPDGTYGHFSPEGYSAVSRYLISTLNATRSALATSIK